MDVVRKPRRNYILRERLDVLEVLLDVLRNSLLLATGDSQRTVQALYEFKKISTKKIYYLKAIFRATTTIKVSVFIRNFVMFYLECRCTNRERLAKNYIVSVAGVGGGSGPLALPPPVALPPPPPTSPPSSYAHSGIFTIKVK